MPRYTVVMSARGGNVYGRVVYTLITVTHPVSNHSQHTEQSRPNGTQQLQPDVQLQPAVRCMEYGVFRLPIPPEWDKLVPALYTKVKVKRTMWLITISTTRQS